MLSSLLKAKPTEVEVEYPEAPGFWVTVRYMGAAEIERAMEDRKLVVKGGKVRDIGGFNDTLRIAVARAIVSWRGLGKEALKVLNLDIDMAAVEAMPDDAEVPCDQGAKEILLRSDAVFFRWMQDMATSIVELRQAEEAALEKNSPTSQGGTPDPA